MTEQPADKKKIDEVRKIEVASTLYRETCNNIRATDEISFKLLGLVPLISGAGIFFISLSKEFASSPFAVIISFFGAIVTAALFMWEWRNIKYCISFVKYAELLESRIFYDALGKLGEEQEKQLALEKLPPKCVEEIKMETKIAKGQFAGRGKSKILKKRNAEAILYTATIIAWLALGIMSLIRLTG